MKVHRSILCQTTGRFPEAAQIARLLYSQRKETVEEAAKQSMEGR